MHNVIAISIGAILGAMARWRLGVWLNQSTAVLPWGTLAVNWIGAYIVGLAVVFFQSQAQMDPVWRLAVITGFLGTLTTFSAFSAEVVTMLQQGRYTLAMVTTSLHLFGSLLLTWLGMRTAALWFTPA